MSIYSFLKNPVARLPKRLRKAYYNWRKIKHYDGIPLLMSDNLVVDRPDTMVIVYDGNEEVDNAA